MISLYSGTPGSGKSLHCAKLISDYMSSNAPCIVNFPISKRNLKKISSQMKNKGKLPIYSYDNSEITPQFLKEFSDEYFLDHKFKEGHILLIIDECQLMFNSREYNKSNRQEWIWFFTQHRKLGYEVILIAQFDRMIDRQIRSLIEYEFIHRQVSNFGRFGKVITLFGLFKLFCVVKRYYPLNEKVGTSFLVCSKKLYKIYDTNYMFTTA